MHQWPFLPPDYKRRLNTCHLLLFFVSIYFTLDSRLYSPCNCKLSAGRRKWAIALICPFAQWLQSSAPMVAMDYFSKEHCLKMLQKNITFLSQLGFTCRTEHSHIYQKDLEFIFQRNLNAKPHSTLWGQPNSHEDKNSAVTFLASLSKCSHVIFMPSETELEMTIHTVLFLFLYRIVTEISDLEDKANLKSPKLKIWFYQLKPWEKTFV